MMDAEAVIFYADENGRDHVRATKSTLLDLDPAQFWTWQDISLHENHEARIMCSMVVQIIQTRKDDQPNRSNYSSYGGDNRHPFLEPRRVHRQSTAVSEPALGDEDEIK
jgi:hypothetical protein